MPHSTSSRIRQAFNILDTLRAGLGPSSMLGLLLLGSAAPPASGQDAADTLNDAPTLRAEPSSDKGVFDLEPLFVISAPGDASAADTSTCTGINVVFVMDTSGSMGDEFDVLCDNIQQIVSDLELLGIDIQGFFLSISGGAFACLTGGVVNQLGSEIPGDDTCDADHGESWGPAAAIVADRFPWQIGAERLIITLSDEGPCEGDFCADPGADRDSITNAIQICNTNGVIVSPITGSGSSPCVITLAQDLADGTDGSTFASTDPASDLVGAIVDIISDVSCQTALATTILEAGIPDGFTPPIEPTSPSPVLANLLLDCTEAPLEFDELAQNSCFGHTFTGLPDFIVGATLEIRLRAVTEAGAELQCNDLINLQTTGLTPPFLWTRRIGSGGAFGSCAGDGVIPFPWVEGTDYTMILDLSQLPNADGSTTSILNSLINTRKLDIRVNDDTGVDYIRLILRQEFDCNGNAKPDLDEMWLFSDGFVNGDFSNHSQGWRQKSQGDGTVTYDGATATISSRDDGELGTTSIHQGVILPTGGIMDFDLLSYTSTDISIFDFPVLVIDDLPYGLNHDGTLSNANGIGTIRNDAPALSTVHFAVDVALVAGAGPKEIEFGVRTFNAANGPGVAVFDNISPSFSFVTNPNCNLNGVLDDCEIDDSFSGFSNGDFGSLGDEWMHHIQGSGSVQYDGRVQVTADDSNWGGSTFISQDVLDLPSGIMEFDLISYTSTDVGPADHPILMIDSTLYGLNLDGTLSVPTGIGTIRNSDQVLSPIHFSVDVESLHGPGLHILGLGVRSLTGIGGAGVAVYDNINPGLVQMVLDCDLNGILDTCDIEADPGLDLDVNGILDACECQADCAAAGADGQIDVLDLIDMLANWGAAVGDCDFVPPGGDGQVDVLDLIELLAAWGVCVP